MPDYASHRSSYYLVLRIQLFAVLFDIGLDFVRTVQIS